MTLYGRGTLDRDQAQVDNNIMRLASMIDEAIGQAMDALSRRDIALAQMVVANDDNINQLRFEIEEQCLLILATQQPVATDLRTVVAAIYIVSELERMGDHAAGIARLVRRLEEDPDFDSLHKLPKMTNRARTMLKESVEAYIRRDKELALMMMRRDDKLDRQYRKLFHETLEEMRDDQYIRRATFLLWVGHDLERIGDRATNIAERVIFMTTGKFVENISLDD